jgi:hypothetical protein
VVIPKWADVKLAAGHGCAFNLGHQKGEPLCNRPASPEHSDDYQFLSTLVCLKYLVRHASQRSSHVTGVEQHCAHVR